ncbi:DUF3224 domain-containing protein [Streptomyces albus subsp. chlorinus]|uniref:DUF3224 domain-containing protein n=1 Tax=Streptomyces albus TaxID=1888 RepID=UPI00156F7347|nr:DUF3224 domain-containing protein [Streptomyces albus]NSC23254.1 DUF3224 domain-containing protein [Streptomyces albus subsp. chlorinus]
MASASRTTTAAFTGVSWDEKDVSGSAPGPRLARASVVNDYTGGIEAKGAACAYTLTYVTEVSGVFSGMERLDGSLDGRPGTFVVHQDGSFDEEGVIRCTFTVVPGSGTDGLAGLTGKGGYEVRPGEQRVEVTFTYELD